MNDTDSQILGLLQDNARISITEIANKLRISRNTVQKLILKHLVYNLKLYKRLKHTL